MSERRGLLLRVGIDTGCGGTLGPVFPDGSFEYVPIPETPQKAGSRARHFTDLPAKGGGFLDQYVPGRYAQGPAHYDPEFETLTYGDPTLLKRRQLLKMKAGDLLVFYAGLRAGASTKAARLFIIGYFTLASVQEIPETSPWPPRNLRHLNNNAHLRRAKHDPGLVVVQGQAGASGLLAKALPISDERQMATEWTAKWLGVHGSLMRAIGRWVPADRIARLEALLGENRVSE